MGTTQQVILTTTVVALAPLSQQRFVGPITPPARPEPWRSVWQRWMLLPVM